jgi:predicted 3-demethylubiquinone-9 3-methyltransferase (glyoxalase superfamily)
MAIETSPQIFFYERCAEALAFYSSVFGRNADLLHLTDTPAEVQAYVPPSSDGVMHPASNEHGGPSKSTLAALAEGGGKVHMPSGSSLSGRIVCQCRRGARPRRGRDAAMSETITPFLWFDGKAEEAAEFYVSVFRSGRILRTTRNTESAPGETSAALTVEFELEGQRFIGLNGGPHFSFTPAVSFMIDCKDQADVDHFWSRPTADGGRPSQCGWLQDKFGLSWQVVPQALPRLLKDDNEAKADAVMQAMLKMSKLDVAALQAAYDEALALLNFISARARAVTALNLE